MFQVPAERLVHGGQDGCGIVGATGLGGKRDLDHRCDERRRNPVSRYVRDKQSDAARAKRDDVVDVARDGSHGHEPGRDIEPGMLRERARQQRQLDPSCRFELALHARELRLCAESSPDHRIRETEHEYEHADGLGMGAWEDDPADVLVDGEHGKGQRASDHDPLGQDRVSVRCRGGDEDVADGDGNHDQDQPAVGWQCCPRASENDISADRHHGEQRDHVPNRAARVSPARPDDAREEERQRDGDQVRQQGDEIAPLDKCQGERRADGRLLCQEANAVDPQGDAKREQNPCALPWPQQ